MVGMVAELEEAQAQWAHQEQMRPHTAQLDPPDPPHSSTAQLDRRGTREQRGPQAQPDLLAKMGELGLMVSQVKQEYVDQKDRQV